MAITRDEEIYNLRKAALDNNIKQWQDWSVSINYVVDQFNDVIENLTERLDIAETTIEALMTKINHMDQTYVKLQYNSITIMSNRTYYTKTCGVYSDVSKNNPKYPVNIVYVYSDRTVHGLYVNDQPVYEKHIGDFSNNTNSYYMPFMQFSGSNQGIILNIKTNDADKIGGNTNLYFSLDSTLGSLQPSQNDDTTQQLQVKINYSSVAQKSLYTLDKSQLSQTIIKNTAMIDNKRAIDKDSVAIEQYSTTKTVANAAEQKSGRTSSNSTRSSSSGSTTRR